MKVRARKLQLSLTKSQIHVDTYVFSTVRKFEQGVQKCCFKS